MGSGLEVNPLVKVSLPVLITAHATCVSLQFPKWTAIPPNLRHCISLGLLAHCIQDLDCILTLKEVNLLCVYSHWVCWQYCSSLTHTEHHIHCDVYSLCMLTTSSILIILAQCSGSIDVGCGSQVCEFQANWTVQGDSVEFSVSAQTTGWVGIGFSDDQFMVSIHLWIF